MVDLHLTESYIPLALRCRNCIGDHFTVKSLEIPVTLHETTILVAVEVAECDQCGYQLVDGPNAAKLDAAYDRLEAGDISRLIPVGVVYRQ